MFDDDTDFTDVVEERFPYDGPHSPERVREAARGADALIRYLNNATGPWVESESLPYAPHTYRLLGSVDATMHNLDQLLGQVSTALNRHASDVSLYDDRRGDYVGADTAREAVTAIEGARRALRAPRTRVDDAWQLTSHLGHDIRDDDE